MKPVTYYLKLVKTGRDSFEIGGVTRNASVNQFSRQSRVVNKRAFGRKLRQSTITIK